VPAGLAWGRRHGRAAPTPGVFSGADSVSRSSWFAIRTPLSPRRATCAKFAAFLLPLALWALVCLVWVPEVIITDQGDSPYKRDDRVPRADFELLNAKIRAEPPQFRLTEPAWQSLQKTELPAPTIKKLEAVKPTLLPNGQFATFAWTDQKAFLKDVRDDPNKEDPDLDPHVAGVWKHLEKETKTPATGDPSTAIWLPSPWRVARAFYLAFVTPPVEGDPWLHQSLWHSCKIIFWGFLLSAIIGVPLGIFCGTFDFFSKLTEPFVDFIRYMPAPASAPSSRWCWSSPIRRGNSTPLSSRPRRPWGPRNALS
jgi:hypothetical protein